MKTASLPRLLWALASMATVVVLLPLAGGCSLLQRNTEPDPVVLHDPGPLYADGFLEDDRAPIALVGPVAHDKEVFERIRQMERSAAFALPDTARELAELLGPSSQTFLAGLAPELFRAGVYHGNPALLALACKHSPRVTHSGLRRQNRLHELEQTCAALATAPETLTNGVCERSLGKLLSGYQALAGGDEQLARKLLADGLRARIQCPDSEPLARSAVAPSSRGFLIVVVLQASGAPPFSWLAHEGAPRIAEAVNQAFVASVAMVHG